MDHERKRTAWMFAIALLALALISMLVSLEINKRRCSRLALEHGYLASEYFPPARMGEAQCIGRKRRNSDGTIDEKVQAILQLPN